MYIFVREILYPLESFRPLKIAAVMRCRESGNAVIMSCLKKHAHWRIQTYAAPMNIIQYSIVRINRLP